MSSGSPDLDTIKMFVGQIPKNWTEEDVKLTFEKFGTIFSATILRDKVTRESRGCCFITFHKRKSALDAQNACHNIRVLPGMSHPMQMKPADNENRHERKIFVGMLTRTLTEADLRGMFMSFGLIEDVSILRDANGVSRGCGFVTFSTKASAINAIKVMHQSSIMEGCSSPLVVKIADLQQKGLKNTEKDKEQQSRKSQTKTSSPAECYLSLLEYLVQQSAQLPNSSQLQNDFAILNFLASGSGIFPGIAEMLNAQTPEASAQNNLLAQNAGKHHAAPTNINWNQLVNYNVVSEALLSTMMNPSALVPPSTVSMLGQGQGQLLNPNNAQGQLLTPQGVDGPEGSNLFIYHLPQEFSEADLVQLFSPFGLIVSAKIFLDRKTNLSKCFGFVSYDNRVSAQLAIHGLNGFAIGTKRLKVQLKKPKDKPY